MRTVLLAIALVVSLWPAAVVVLAVDWVLGGDDTSSPVAAPATRTATTARAAIAARPAAPTDETEGELGELNRLRDETATLVVALNDSPAASGLPDADLAGQALDIEAALVSWQEQHAGANADAEYFARLFTAIASAAADYATAPSEDSRARLDAAIMRHRRETLQEGS